MKAPNTGMKLKHTPFNTKTEKNYISNIRGMFHFNHTACPQDSGMTMLYQGIPPGHTVSPVENVDSKVNI